MKQGGLLPSVFAALFTAVALFALTGYQLTTATAGHRLEGRLAAAMVEIDRWLPTHEDNLRLLARDKPQATLEIPDLPARVSLPSSTVASADTALLRSAIVDSMSRALYSRGNGAFSDAGGKAPSITSTAHWAVAFSSSKAHSFWKAALPLSFLAMLGFSAGVLIANRPLLLSLAYGAALGLAGSALVWLLTSVAGSSLGSPLNREIMLIVRDGAMIGMRNCAAVALPLFVIHAVLHMSAGQQVPWQGQIPGEPDPPSA